MKIIKRNKNKFPHVHVVAIPLDTTPKTEVYQFDIENKSSEPRTWVLGGSSMYLNEKNNGSAPEVKIKTHGYHKYPAFLQDLLTEPIHISKFRIQSQSQENLNKDIFLHGTFMYKKYSSPIEVSKHFDKHQFQIDIIDVNQEFTLDKNHYLEGTIEGKSNIRIVFFVEVEETGFENAPFAFASKHSENTLKVTPCEIQKEELNFFQKIKRLFERKKTKE